MVGGQDRYSGIKSCFGDFLKLTIDLLKNCNGQYELSVKAALCGLCSTSSSSGISTAWLVAKGIQDSLGLDSRYWILDSLSVELWIHIPIIRGILDSVSCISHFKAGIKDFTAIRFGEYQIPQAKISQIPESGWGKPGHVIMYRSVQRFNMYSSHWQPLFILFYFIFICHTIITKDIGKEEKKKWRGDLTETIGAYERLGLLEL